MLCNTALRAVVQGATYSSRILSGGLNVNGSRNVASFKGNKLFGNIVEAWEKREISKVLTSRNPDHFEKFQVGDAIAIRSINPYNPKRMVTFSGICIAIRNGLLGKSFIVRNQVDGVGVEQQFAFYSPLLKV
jgi:ribosomal protein L19